MDLVDELAPRALQILEETPSLTVTGVTARLYGFREARDKLMLWSVQERILIEALHDDEAAALLERVCREADEVQKAFEERTLPRRQRREGQSQKKVKRAQEHILRTPALTRTVTLAPVDAEQLWAPQLLDAARTIARDLPTVTQPMVAHVLEMQRDLRHITSVISESMSWWPTVQESIRQTLAPPRSPALEAALEALASARTTSYASRYFSPRLNVPSRGLQAPRTIKEPTRYALAQKAVEERLARIDRTVWSRLPVERELQDDPHDALRLKVAKFRRRVERTLARLEEKGDVIAVPNPSGSGKRYSLAPK